MRRKLCFRGHQAYFPRFTAHIAHTKRVVIAHAPYRPAPPHFTIGKAVNTRDREFGHRYRSRYIYSTSISRSPRAIHGFTDGPDTELRMLVQRV